MVNWPFIRSPLFRAVYSSWNQKHRRLKCHMVYFDSARYWEAIVLQTPPNLICYFLVLRRIYFKGINIFFEEFFQTNWLISKQENSICTILGLLIHRNKFSKRCGLSHALRSKWTLVKWTKWTLVLDMYAYVTICNTV